MFDLIFSWPTHLFWYIYYSWPCFIYAKLFVMSKLKEITIPYNFGYINYCSRKLDLIFTCMPSPFGGRYSWNSLCFWWKWILFPQIVPVDIYYVCLVAFNKPVFWKVLISISIIYIMDIVNNNSYVNTRYPKNIL